MKKQNIRTLALIVSTFTYLLIGAAVFDSFESEHEKNEKTRLLKSEQQFKDKYNITDEDYRNISRNVILSEPHKAGVQWKFAGSFFFATTVITTIGYGHSAPKTAGGKIFCMLYALAGIPLNLVMFQSIGERLNIIVTYLLRNLKKCLRYKNSDVSQTHLILISMNMSSMVVLGGAWVFSRCEEWTYLDSFYYCVVTLTTVGFGDYVVLQQDNVLQRRPDYVVFSILFILFGLAVVSAAMNLLVLRFLTMNTVDERRDELQAAVAMRTSAKLDGDIITVNGSVLSGLHSPMVRHNADLTIDMSHLHTSSSSNHISEAPPDLRSSFLSRFCLCCCYQPLPDKDGLVYAQETPQLKAVDSKQAARRRYKVTRSPISKVSHLLPMQLLLQDYADDTGSTRKASLCGDSNQHHHENGWAGKVNGEGGGGDWRRGEGVGNSRLCYLYDEDVEDDDDERCRAIFNRSARSHKRTSI